MSGVGMSLRNGEPRCLSLRRGFLYEGKAMQWRRGFFRIWIVLAAIWIVGLLTLALNDTSIPSLNRGRSELLNFRLDKSGESLGPTDVAQCEAVWKKERIRWAIWMLAPPLA